MSESRREKTDRLAAERADWLMKDTRFQTLRTGRARTSLAVAMIAIIVLMPVGWIVLGQIAGLLLVIAAAVVWVMLRLSVRLVADLPEEYLDERQADLRNRNYVEAYRSFAGFVVIFFGAGLMAFTFFARRADTVIVTVDYEWVMGIFWMVEAAALSIPSIVLALRDRELPR